MPPQRKSLSGATMGMRFMQRKTPNKEVASNQNNNISSSSENIIPTDNLTSSSPFSPQHKQENKIECDPSVPLVATDADMYGISAQIIGRRSFNGFNKAVEQTWTAAVKNRQEKRLGDKVEKMQISDEELLQRYEKYVKGQGDMVDVKPKAIGNLNKKKRKRNQKKE